MPRAPQYSCGTLISSLLLLYSSCIKLVCVYLPAAFHNFYVVFALKVAV